MPEQPSTPKAPPSLSDPSDSTKPMPAAGRIRAPGEPADDARPQDIELYCVMLTFTMQRLALVDQLLAEPKLRAVDIETAALNVRMALESVVLSTLIANRPASAAAADAFSTKTASEARRIVKRVNPKYWPVPFKYRRSVDKYGREAWHMDPPDDVFLREDDWGKAYGYCSSLLHATNPYQYLVQRQAPKSHLAVTVEELKAYSLKIQALLRRHQIYLTEADVSLICRVPDDLTTRPTVEVYQRERKQP